MNNTKQKILSFDRIFVLEEPNGLDATIYLTDLHSHFPVIYKGASYHFAIIYIF